MQYIKVAKANRVGAGCRGTFRRKITVHMSGFYEAHQLNRRDHQGRPRLKEAVAREYLFLYVSTLNL